MTPENTPENAPADNPGSPAEAVAPAVCPRCRTPRAVTVAHSPVPGRWTMRSCPVCRYAWRSTEPLAATDPDSYPETFRVDPSEIGSAIRIV